MMQQKLLTDDLYAKLRQVEGVLPTPAAMENIAMGSWTPGGSFVGLGSTCTLVFAPVKRKVGTPPTTTRRAPLPCAGWDDADR